MIAGRVARAALLIVAFFAAPLSVDAAPVAPQTATLTIDGIDAEKIGISRRSDRVMIAVDPIADALGWHVQTSAVGWSLVGEGRRFIIRPNTPTVKDGEVDVLVFAMPPATIGKRLYLAAADLERLFDVKLHVSPRSVAVTTTDATPNAGTVIAEHARPAPQPTPKPARTAAPASTHNVAGNRLAVTLVQSGGDRSYHVALTTVGSARGVIETTQGGIGPNYLGNLTVGTATRSITAGNFSDPSAGALFHDRSPIGVLVHQNEFDLYGGRRAQDGRALVGVAHRDGATIESLEVLRNPGGAFDEVLAGIATVRNRSWGSWRQEAFLGSRGFGALESVRTSGRLFAEGALRAKIGTLAVDDDAPYSANVGYDASRSTTARAGLRGGGSTMFSPFVGLFTHGAHYGGSFSFSRSTVSVAASYVDPISVLQVAFARSAGVSAMTVRASTSARRDTALEFNGDLEAADSTARFTARRPLGTLDVIGGWGFDRSALGLGSGPVLGVASPVVRGLSIEARLEPRGRRETFKLDLIASLSPLKRVRRAVTVPLNVHVPLAGLPARLLVDGLPFTTLADVDSRVQMPGGVHAFSVESTDGKLASLPLQTTGVTQEADISLWPLREISGRLVIKAPAAVVPRDLSLSDVQIVLLPSGMVTRADAGGHFSFGVQPFVAGATLGFLAESLPPGLGDGTTTPLVLAGETTMVLRSTQRVEKVKF